MKIIEKIKIPAETRNRLSKLRCDLCGNQTPSGENWTDSRFSFDEVTIQREHGDRFPDGGITESISYQICPQCFTDHLTPFFESRGAEKTIEHTDW